MLCGAVQVLCDAVLVLCDATRGKRHVLGLVGLILIEGDCRERGGQKSNVCRVPYRPKMRKVLLGTGGRRLRDVLLQRSKVNACATRGL
jgi:hypothetical protein